MVSYTVPLLSVQSPLPFLNHTKLIPNSEPLHWLFPSLECHSSKCYTEISLPGVTVHQPPVALTPGLRTLTHSSYSTLPLEANIYVCARRFLLFLVACPGLLDR